MGTIFRGGLGLTLLVGGIKLQNVLLALFSALLSTTLENVLPQNSKLKFRL